MTRPDLAGPGEPSFLEQRFPGLDLGFRRLGPGLTPVRRIHGVPEFAGFDVWVKDESGYGSDHWAGNKVRKLEWLLPEAQRRGVRCLLTVGGIGTHWGLACARYGADAGLDTVLGLVDQPVDDHVREQWSRLVDSPARIFRFRTPTRLKLAAPVLLAAGLRRGRLPWYLPAGGSDPVGTLGYVEAALELADQVARGEMPEPGAVVVPVGSGGTAAGLALGLRIAGLRTRVVAVVVNDALDLSAPAIARLAHRTAALLTERGAGELPRITEDDLTVRYDWLGRTYGDPTPASMAMVAHAPEIGVPLEPVYTGKALAAVADLGSTLPGPLLWLATHGPR